MIRNPRKRRKGASSLKREPYSWNKKAMARLGRWMGVIVTLAILGGGANFALEKLLDPALYPLRHIDVNGELVHTSEAALRNRMAPFLGTSFYLLDMKELQQAAEDLPWITHLNVTRRWPDRVVFELEERKGFGLWGSGEMVDTEGRRFSPAAIPVYTIWPRLHGPDGNEKLVMERYSLARNQVSLLGLTVRSVWQDNRRSWWMQLDNDLVLLLGRDDFKVRLKRFVTIYPKVLYARSDDIEQVDMRYFNGFAVRWKVSPDGSAQAHFGTDNAKQQSAG